MTNFPHFLPPPSPYWLKYRTMRITRPHFLRVVFFFVWCHRFAVFKYVSCGCIFCVLILDSLFVYWTNFATHSYRGNVLVALVYSCYSFNSVFQFRLTSPVSFHFSTNKLDHRTWTNVQAFGWRRKRFIFSRFLCYFFSVTRSNFE